MQFEQPSLKVYPSRAQSCTLTQTMRKTNYQLNTQMCKLSICAPFFEIIFRAWCWYLH